jgi:hypothetical protein
METPTSHKGKPLLEPARLHVSDSEAWLLDTPVDGYVTGFWSWLRAAARPARSRPWAMPYWRLAAAILLANAVILVVNLAQGDWKLDDGSALTALSGLVLVNLAVAVLIRQQQVLNALFGLAGRGRTTWPMWLRWAISKINHVGGIHVGAAVAGTAWLIAFAVVAIVARVRDPATATLTTVVLSTILALLALVVVVGAAPTVRMRAHNAFELTHRFGGWTAVALFWPLAIHLTLQERGDESAAHALLTDWHLWAVAVLTASVASPWLRLRRVPVTVERPSKHAAIVSFDYGKRPKASAGIGVSHSPLREWHAFATVTTPGRRGFRILVSRAGDWTSRFIEDPPSHLWVRGTPVTAPMARVALLHRRVVYVVTGSGIGPCLGQILAAEVPAQLVWSTRSPRATYGDALVDEVYSVQPHAIIWDTTERGKPDLLRLVREAYWRFDAEAVFVVSNKATTFRLCEALERNGIPAVGPIWDS